ncbi:uncharacterized protein [Chironomus tepperi]|uniref:uncharacterized protein n=1 Tax=Chironomus tepperi TaxID=113505 RepID=UPI00391FA4E0
MAVNQHMVETGFPLLEPEYDKEEHKNGTNRYSESTTHSDQYLYINSDYIYRRRLNSLIKLDKDDDHNHHRVIILDGFQSHEDGLNYITNQNFSKFIQSCPFMFVIIIQCEYPTFNEKRNISSILKQRYRTKRPLIVIFESINPKIFYKNHGLYSRFIEYELGTVETEPDVIDFPTMLMNFEVNGLGYFSGCFEQISINNADAGQKLMNKLAAKNDLLGIRFLHLFDSSLRPDVQHIRAILANDYNNTELDGFSAIFDFNIEDYGSRKLIYHSISGRDVHLILNSTFENQENLLMTAIKCHNKNAAKLFIKCGINLNLSNGNETCQIAADIAYKTSQYDILLRLLEANSRFPHDFGAGLFDNLTYELKKFINLTTELHELIRKIDEFDWEKSKENLEKMLCIIQTYPNLDYWYDQSNTSAATKAIHCKKFRTYSFLLRHGLFIGPFEDIQTIKGMLNPPELDIIRNINAANAQKQPKDYLLILQLNSFIWKNKKNENVPADLIEMTFNILDQNEDIRPILQIVAEVKCFRIVFDFNHTSVEALDFTSGDKTCAVFHLRQSHIYIGAKDLLDETKKYETIATLSHELCHLAILLTYNNLCNPYAECDYIKMKLFDKICRECEVLKDKEYLVGLVYLYQADRRHAELIVRAPHMMIHYIKKPNIYSTLNEIYKSLFDFYKTSVLPDIKKTINNVSHQFAENLKFEHEFWEKKKRKQKIIKYSLILAIFLAIGLAGLSLILLMFFEPCILFNTTCSWDGLKELTRQRLLDTEVKFNNNFTKLRHVAKDDLGALRFLSSDQIKSPSTIAINVQDLSLPFRYHDRMFASYSEDYYYNESNCSNKYISSHDLTSYESQSNIHLICDEPVAGKSTTFKHIANHKRSQNPSKWVVYLNFEDFNLETYSKLLNWTSTNVTNFLIDVHNLRRHDKIEKDSIEAEIFKNKFKSGEIIAFMDHIDWIFQKNETVAEQFLQNVLKKSHNNSEFWFATRNYFGEKIEQILNKSRTSPIVRHKLVPIYCEDRDNFIEKSINDKNLTSNEVENVKLRLGEIFNITNRWRNWEQVQLDNICLIAIILNQTIESVQSNSTHINYYNIFEAYTMKILSFMSDLSEEEVKVIRDATDKTLMVVALRYVDVTYNSSLKDVNMTSLINGELQYINYKGNLDFTIYGQNGSLWDIKSPKMQHEIKRGILKVENDKIEFLHKINLEYYIAKYIRDEMWFKPTWGPRQYLFKDKMLFLFNIFKDINTQFPTVQKCIIDAVKSAQSHEMHRISYDEDFKEFYKELYLNFTTGTNIQVYEYLKDVFDDDEDMKDIIMACGKTQMENFRRFRLANTTPSNNAT